MIQEKYSVSDPWKLKSWRSIAENEIRHYLENENYRDHIDKTTMVNEYMGPFTKFLYHFASKCECGWGVMVDFNEKSQRVFLPNHYYKWMHKLRDEIEEGDKFDSNQQSIHLND